MSCCFSLLPLLNSLQKVDKERDRQKTDSSADSLPKCPQKPGLDQAIRSQELIQSGSPTGVAGTRALEHTCCLPGCICAGSWKWRGNRSLETLIGDTGARAISACAELCQHLSCSPGSVCLPGSWQTWILSLHVSWMAETLHHRPYDSVGGVLPGSPCDTCGS